MQENFIANLQTILIRLNILQLAVSSDVAIVVKNEAVVVKSE